MVLVGFLRIHAADLTPQSSDPPGKQQASILRIVSEPFARLCEMANDRLSQLPYELLEYIIRHLEPLTLFDCRLINSHYKILIGKLPEYRAYQENFENLRRQYNARRHDNPGDSGGKDSPPWSLQMAATLFNLVQLGIEVDNHLLAIIEREPEMEGCMNECL